MGIRSNESMRPAAPPIRPRDGSKHGKENRAMRCTNLQLVLQPKVNKLRLRSDALSAKITNVDRSRRLLTNCNQEISHEPYFRTSFV